MDDASSGRDLVASTPSDTQTSPPQDQPPAVLQSGPSAAKFRRLMRQARQQHLHAIPPTPGAAITIGGTEYTVGPRGNLLRRGR